MQLRNMVFISHASADKGLADALSCYLEARKLKCWLAYRDIPAGKEYATAIIEAIERAGVFIVILSRFSQESSHVIAEVEHAFHIKVSMVPFRTDDYPLSGSFSYFLSSRQWLTAFDKEPQHAFGELYRNCKAIMDAKGHGLEKDIPAVEVRPFIVRPPWWKPVWRWGLAVLVGSAVYGLSFIRPGVVEGANTRLSGAAEKDRDSIIQTTGPVVVPDSVKKLDPVTRVQEVIKSGKNSVHQPAHGDSTAVSRGNVVVVSAEVAGLNGATFKPRNYASEYISLVEAGQGLFEFNGSLEIYQINGRMKLKGNVLKVISGNVKGSLVVSSDATRLNGQLEYIKVPPAVYIKVDMRTGFE